MSRISATGDTVSKIKRMVPMLVWMATIFYYSHRPGKTLDLISFFPFMDKVVHFFVYGLLGVCVMYGLAGWSMIQRRLIIILSSVSISVLYGVADEIHQSFIPGRVTSGSDILADLVGASVFCLLFVDHTSIRNGIKPFC